MLAVEISLKYVVWLFGAAQGYQINKYRKQMQIGIDIYGPLLFELDKVIVQFFSLIMIFAS